MRTSLIGIVGAVVVAVVVAVLVAADSVDRAGLPAVVWCVIAAFAVNWAVFVPSWLRRTEVFFDLTGSLTYLSVTALALILADERPAIAWLMAALIGVWAARLGTFLFRRIRADGKDGRFDKIKTDFLRLLMTWTLQGLWVSLTAIAAWTAITVVGGAETNVLTWIGLAVWLLGFGIEVRSDQEKSAFRADPANDGKFISTGLWAWSRHPNYFGEIVLWIGIALMALPSLSGTAYAALISPVFVMVLLTRISGVPMLEARGRKRWGDDPAYQAYVAKTPVLLLRPPRQG
ncbi:MAG: DUF1295 domain-containing protein [Actinomycetota bacterium]